MQERYIERPLTGQLLRFPRKVIVLEGARAVGKTSLVMRELVEKHGFHYETLADEQTFRYANRYLDEWLHSLPLPTVIDEAQRIKGLPLAVKEIADASAASSPQFILTGSASITRAGLDGQDPLTRRSQRFTLYPLTRREINGMAGTSIVDQLWSAEPNPRYQADNSRGELLRAMSMGGFPTYVLGRPIREQERALMIRSDIDNVLADAILPDERFDRSIAQDILRALLSIPGRDLNISKLANQVMRSKQTVQSDIGIFLRRFLISYLPNLALGADKQNLTHAKIHPIDTSFSVETLKHSGKDPLERNNFGMLFESYAVSQIMPEIQWSDVHPDAFYWRTTGRNSNEVDLVLIRDNEIIGIEMKGSDRLHQGDFQGLEALKAADSRFMRGYVLYAGNEVKRHSADMWALPISALWQHDAFLPREKPDATLRAMPGLAAAESLPPQERQLTDANLFLSYNHGDDDYLGGAIVQFAQEIAKRYHFETGRHLGLFVDKTGINWGDDWRQALELGVNAANFFMPAVTPGYLSSEACRKEFMQFMVRLGDTPRERILPLLWQDIDSASASAKDDPIRRQLEGTQWIDVKRLQHLQPASIEYRQITEAIVGKLRRIVDESQSRAAQGPEKTAEDRAASAGATDGSNALASIARIEGIGEDMRDSFGMLGNAMAAVISRMNEDPIPQNASASQLLDWSNAFASSVEPDITAMRTSLETVSGYWNEGYAAFRQYGELLKAMPQGAARQSAEREYAAQLRMMDDAFTLPENVKQAMPLLRFVGSMMPALRPMADAFEDTVRFFDSIKAAIQELLA